MKNAYVTKTAYSMICALCIAFSAAVQTAFSSFGANCAVYFSVLICAVCCPLSYGILCAVICPIFSMMCAASPSAVLIPGGIAKCLVFVLLSRFILRNFSSGKIFGDMYVSLVPSVCIGQIADAVVCSAIFCGDINSAIMFAVARLAAAIPEIVILLAIIPGTVAMLRASGFADAKLFTEYSKKIR